MTWFGVKDLQRLAGDASFRRGEGYLSAVECKENLPGSVVATVRGTDNYTVRLSYEGGILTGECSCPHGAEGAFCKHSVAVGLVVLEDGAAPTAGEDLGGYLRSLDHGELVALLVRYAELDPIVHRELALRAASSSPGQDSDAAALVRQLDAALPAGFVGPADRLDYARKANSILDVLDELQAAGRPRTVAPLARRAMDRIASVVPDRDYPSSELTDARQRALTLAAQACAQAPPDPAELGIWLLGHALNAGHWPDVQLAAFAPALGTGGLTAIRDRVAPGRIDFTTDTDTDYEDESAEIRQRRLWRLREELAETDGDVDAHIAVLSEQLPSADISRRIAQMLWDANRIDEALQHALREFKRSPLWDAEPLADFLTEAYLQLGQGAKAVELRGGLFDDSPSRKTYRGLRDVATKLGHWPQTRKRALVSYHKAAATGYGVADELVHTLLFDESDVEGAWQAMQDYKCSSEVQVRIARHRGETHPADAVPVYQMAAEKYIEEKKPRSYRAAARLLRDLRDLHTRAGTSDEFQQYLNGLRAQHRRKARLFEELKGVGLH